MNNREIKFRMWNPVANKMVYNPKRIALDIGEEIDINKIFSDSTPPLNSEKMVWMQFTGLLDKNDKEIYEGDLFNCLYFNDGHTDHFYEVVYSEENTGFILKRHGKKCGQTYVRQMVSDHSDWRGEIIGNIHENKELLNNKQIN